MNRSTLNDYVLLLPFFVLLTACTTAVEAPSTEGSVPEPESAGAHPDSILVSPGGRPTKGCFAPDPCAITYFSSSPWAWGNPAHYACGTRVDACGFTINCGGCDWPQLCEAGHDVAHPTYEYCF